MINTYQHLRIEDHGQVLLCILSNPPLHTLNGNEVAELHHFLDYIEKRGDLRVLALTGAGTDVFIKHYELQELADLAESDDPPPSGQINPLHQLILRMRKLPLVVVAGINGKTAGGGLELALGCDLRLLADGDFGIGLPETRAGLIPGAGGTQLLSRLIGISRALDLILHGKLVTPTQALECGIVNKLLPQQNFRPELLAYCQELASCAPLALREAKRAIHAGWQLPLEQAFALESAAFEVALRTDDAKRAMQAKLAEQPGEEVLKDFPWQGK